MKNITKRVLVLSAAFLFALTQVDANLEQGTADKLVKTIWETTQESVLTKEDSITNLAWTSQDEMQLAADVNYELVACAADMEDKDPADKLTKAIWADEKKQELADADKVAALAWTYEAETKPLTKEDAITNIAWAAQEETLATEDYEIVACAAEIETKEAGDEVTRAIWSK